MNNLTARPRVLKQVNLSSVRKAIKEKGTATRTEIAAETKISATTVRTLLTEMQLCGEIESVGYDESSGGRKAERYRFKKDRYYGAAFCISDSDSAVHYLLVNICGEIVQTGKLEAIAGDIRAPILRFLDTLTRERDIKAIGLGVPGVVSGGWYLKSGRDRELYQNDIGGELSRRYGIPVILENDLNAIMLGFSSCYERQFPRAENPNMAYLYFERGCVSASFIAEGNIVRGWNNYAGELSLIDNAPLAAFMAAPVDGVKYVSAIANIICWICAILNPKYIALGGSSFSSEYLGPLGDALYALLPSGMTPEVLYAPDIWHDYYAGMAHLTAGKIFGEAQLITE